jgi:hypothetical protein
MGKKLDRLCTAYWKKASRKVQPAGKKLVSAGLMRRYLRIALPI